MLSLSVRFRPLLSPVTCCDICGEPLYWEDELYEIEGEVVCAGCLTDYARDRFAPMRRTGRGLFHAHKQ